MKFIATPATPAAAEPPASSALRAVRYDDETSVLEIEFAGGVVYRYLDVPRSIHRELMAAASKDAFFETLIKDGYVYQQVS